MSERAFNFSAGPGALPEPVIKQAQEDLWNFRGSGMGVCELSHRGPEFDEILAEAFSDCREVGSIPDDYHILFLQGGATTQADMVPMNFLQEGMTADYLETGKWAEDAIKEAGYYAKLNGGKVHVAGSTKAGNYRTLPAEKDCSYTANAAYLLYVSNNTIFGLQYNRVPQTKSPLVCDMSSDMFSRPIDWSHFDLVYAGAQKNLGPSGQALVIIKDEFLQKAPKDRVGRMHDYHIHASKESRFNTPNTFAIYLMGQTFKWIRREFGSLDQVDQYNKEKAAIIYDAIDNSDFFEAHVTEQAARSLMNITFKTPTPELDAEFCKQAKKHGLLTLEGHRQIGGMRASIYNAFPIEGCRKLAEYMKTFESQHRTQVAGASA
ncbi:MAG: 3-phosphoserine/phosphohydroxythreonine transaminase [Phycisphaerales bacterium]